MASGRRRVVLGALVAVLVGALVQAPAGARPVPAATGPHVSHVSPASGSIYGGTTVTIDGYGLSNPTRVDFGTTPATIVHRSYHRLVVRSPAHAATHVDVRITTANGASPTSTADHFAYLYPSKLQPVSDAIHYLDGDGHPTLRWHDPRTPALSGIVIRRSGPYGHGPIPPPKTPTSGTGVFSTHSTKIESFTDLGPKLYTGAWYYSVFAMYANGRWAEPASFGFYDTEEPYPGETSDVTATDPTTDGVTLHWHNPKDDYSLSGVQIWRTDGTTPPEQALQGHLVANVDVPDETFTDDEALPGHTYSYTVLGRTTKMVATRDKPDQSVTVATLPEQPRAWSSAQPMPPAPTSDRRSTYIGGQSCPSTTLCVAVSATDLVSYYRDGRWSTPAQIEADGGRLVGVSCPTVTFCRAVDADGAVIDYDGHTWTPSGTADPAGEPVDISCVSATFCVVIAQDGTATTWNGTAWSMPAQIAEAGQLAQVSCGSPTLCAVRTQTVQGKDGPYDVIVWDHGNWTAQEISSETDPFREFAGVACTTGFCLAAADDGQISRIVGGTTHTDSVPTVPGGVLSIACASPTFCEAAGRYSHARFDGTDWTSIVEPEDFATRLSCAGPTLCAGWDDAQTWTEGGHGLPVEGIPFPYASSQKQVTCPSDTFCLAAENDYVRTFDGSTWSAPRRIPGLDYPGPVSCTSATFCMALGYGNAYAVFDGTRWTTSTSTSVTVGQLACVSATFCLATTQTTVVRWNGSTWSAPIDTGVVAYGVAFDISCVSASFCLLTSGDKSVRWNGHGLDDPVTVGSSSAGNRPSLGDVSCVPDPYTGPVCMAVGELNHVYTYRFGKWSVAQEAEPQHYDQRGLADDQLRTISCAAPVSCMVIDWQGNAVVVKPDAAQTPAPVDTSPDSSETTYPVAAFGIDSVSCASTSFCVAVDAQAPPVQPHAYVYR